MTSYLFVKTTGQQGINALKVAQQSKQNILQIMGRSMPPLITSRKMRVQEYNIQEYVGRGLHIEALWSPDGGRMYEMRCETLVLCQDRSQTNLHWSWSYSQALNLGLKVVVFNISYKAHIITVFKNFISCHFVIELINLIVSYIIISRWLASSSLTVIDRLNRDVGMKSKESLWSSACGIGS